jgi:hypothetical protein
MKEFMLYIRNDKDAKESLSEADHMAFTRGCETYNSGLTVQNKMISAQPLVVEGVVLSENSSGWTFKRLKIIVNSPSRVLLYSSNWFE